MSVVQKKKLVTGATVQVKGDEIAKMNTTNPLQAMQGQTPGVSIASHDDIHQKSTCLLYTSRCV